MADTAIDDLLERVQQDLSALQPLVGAVDTIADRVPDLEARFPGAAGAARSVLGMTTDVLAALPSPEEMARLARGLAGEIAPPVDADAFRQEVAAAVTALAGVVESVADQPELPTIDLEPVEDLLAELTDKIPDSVVGQIGGLVQALDLGGITRRAEELRALVAEIRSGPSDAELKAAQRKVAGIRAYLQITSAALGWLRDTFPFSCSADAFVVAKVEISAVGATALKLAPLQMPLDTAILVASYLIELIRSRRGK